jgi:hypothetical protein
MRINRLQFSDVRNERQKRSHIRYLDVLRIPFHDNLSSALLLSRHLWRRVSSKHLLAFVFEEPLKIEALAHLRFYF